MISNSWCWNSPLLLSSPRLIYSFFLMLFSWSPPPPFSSLILFLNQNRSKNRSLVVEQYQRNITPFSPKCYCKVFIRPIRAANVLSKQELSILFINWKDLIITNTKLMKSMRIRRSTVQSQSMIGDILCENVRPCHPKSSQLSVKIFVAVPSDDCLHSFLFLPALGSSSPSKAGIENGFFGAIYLSLCSLVR